ncbi:MAG TPA: OB-fold nucleic acid binding domain-containing protein, partial [Sphingomonadaceae bacterium]|nr:OB-fold nucleic acid binding domain-containing protein [Sphingomonadaceae bacterium]
IQGDMVHPYLRRRRGDEQVLLPAPDSRHGPPDELSSILGRTLGVPIFQEQAMKIALDAAKFSSAEANRLRRAMATFRSRGNLQELEGMMVGRMVDRGYDPDFAARCFNQIKGFGEYGFPESHAASFALLVYVSSWIKCHYPAAFACALLNSQPMGFYAPAQIVRDAREHGVTVLPPDVNCSEWDCTLEALPLDGGGLGGGDASGMRHPHPASTRLSFDKLRIAKSPHPSPIEGEGEIRLALRLGLRQVDGLPEHAAALLVAARAKGGPFGDVAELRERAGLSAAHIERLAAADCFTSLELSRRQALWDARSLIAAPGLPLFDFASTREEGAEKLRTALPAMPLAEEVVADYQTQRLSLKAHPLAFLRPHLGERGFLRCRELRERRQKAQVQLAGVVLIRQRPGSAKGVCFITIEDETGVANVVVWPDMMQRFRPVIMGARLLEVRGRVEYDDEVIHVIATHLADATGDLHRLSDDLLSPAMDHADHVNRPMQGSRGHPRNVRVIPKSRDFH